MNALRQIGNLATGLAMLAGSSTFAAPPEAAPPPPATVDLRATFEQYGLTPRRQGDRPTCSAFTVTGALEFAAAKHEGRGARLSVEFLNWAANKTCGDTDDGGFFSDLWKGFAAYGICREEEMPYRPTFETNHVPSALALANAATRLPLALKLHWIKEWDVNTGLTDAHLAAIKRTLGAGWPVCGGFRWPKQEQWVNEMLQLCPTNAVRDGHSILLVGYRDDAAQPGGGAFLFRNTSRQGRDGAMPYAYAQAYMNDAVWVDCEVRPESGSAGGTASPAGLPRP
jgi:C1A family cysteine protease